MPFARHGSCTVLLPKWLFDAMSTAWSFTYGFAHTASESSPV
jgi:hypothetical protein